MQVTERDAGALAEGLLEVLPRLHRLVRLRLPAADQEGQQCLERRGGEFPEKPGQLKLMWILSRRGRLSMQEMASLLEVTPPTVTGMVKRLLEQGYVERVRDEADWRTVWVELTDEGREAITKHRQERVALLRSRIEQLSDEEQARLWDALPVLSHLLDV